MVSTESALVSLIPYFCPDVVRGRVAGFNIEEGKILVMEEALARDLQEASRKGVSNETVVGLNSTAFVRRMERSGYKSLLLKALKLLFSQARKHQSPFDGFQTEMRGVVAFCGLPISEVGKPGASVESPTYLRADLMECPLTDLGCRPIDRSHIVDLGNLNIPRVSPVFAEVIIGTSASILYELGIKCVFIGGTHLISAPIIDGIYPKIPNLSLVWLDAHTDLYHQGSYSAEESLRFSDSNVLFRILERNPSLASRTYLVGTRVAGGESFASLPRKNIFTILDIRRKGLDVVLTDLCSRLAGSEVYVSVDMDVVDPAFAPGVTTPCPPGLSSVEFLYALNVLGENSNVIGGDLNEMDFGRDVGGLSRNLVARGFMELLSCVNPNGAA